MNIETLKERLYNTKLMSLIKNKREKQKDLEQFKYRLNNGSVVIPIMSSIVSALILGYAIYILYTSNPILIMLSICSTLALSMPISFIIDEYRQSQYEEALDINSLLEEIKKELSNLTIQKIIVDYVNALAITYPEYQTVSKNIKKALIENNYDEANNCLELILINKDVMIENTLIIEEQKKIDKYEKEIGAEIFSNKEIEKGWTRIL